MNLIDEFRGNDARLIDCIEALVAMSDDGVLRPHGVGGHARDMLSASAVRLAERDATITQLRAELERVKGGCRNLIAELDARANRLSKDHNDYDGRGVIAYEYAAEELRSVVDGAGGERG